MPSILRAGRKLTVADRRILRQALAAAGDLWQTQEESERAYHQGQPHAETYSASKAQERMAALRRKGRALERAAGKLNLV